MKIMAKTISDLTDVALPDLPLPLVLDVPCCGYRQTVYAKTCGAAAPNCISADRRNTTLHER